MPVPSNHRKRIHALSRINRVPGWLTKEDRAGLLAAYVEAARLTSITGVAHHVDHIVPLRSPVASGPHVPWNLRVIPAHQNLRKGNCMLYDAQGSFDFPKGATHQPALALEFRRTKRRD